MAIASAYQDHHGMTINMRLFCEHYISNNRNGVKAVRSAYGGNKSDNVCHAMASENLRKPVIKKYIEARMKEVIDKVGVGVEWRLELLKKTAEASFDGRASKEGIVNTDGVVKTLAEINKMDGSYAATQTESKISVEEVDHSHVDKIIQDNLRDE
jgi:phage terminase small subunit